MKTKATTQTKRKEEIVIPVKTRASSFCDPIKFKILEDDEVRLTKKLAFDFLEAKTFDGERAVRENHVQHLYDEWVAGRFLWHHVILGLAKLKGEVYRMNGQHTCWMRVNIPEREEPVKADVRLIIYQVQDEEDLRSLYSTFDRNAPRTPGHIARVMLMDSDAGEGIPTSYIGKLMAGFKVHFSPTSKHYKTSPDEWIGMVMKNYPGLFNTVGRFFQIHYSDGKFVQRAGVLGAMFSTFEKAIKASDEFWTPVCNGIALASKNDPRHRLRQWLLDHSLSSVGIGLLNKKTSTEETYRICIGAWNRWRDGEEASMLRPSDTRVKVKA